MTESKDKKSPGRRLVWRTESVNKSTSGWCCPYCQKWVDSNDYIHINALVYPCIHCDGVRRIVDDDIIEGSPADIHRKLFGWDGFKLEDIDNERCMVTFDDIECSYIFEVIHE